MIEKDRTEEAGHEVYEAFREIFPAQVSFVVEWDDLRDAVKESFRQIATRAVTKYNNSRPDRPCEHEEYYDTGRCAEMSCSNYTSKHRNPA